MGKNKAKKVIQMSNSPESYIKTRARNLPIGKCYINQSWKEKGFATIIISRNHVNGNFTFGVYLVDLYCLGVKDTFYNFNVYTEFIELLDKFKKEQGMVESEYALVHNIIYGAVEYAEDLGFKPDKDFEVSQYLLEEDDDKVEFIDVEFGLNGKPAIFIWKEKHPANIIATLERSVGKGNFTVFSGEDIEGEEEENDWEDEEYDYDEFDEEDEEEDEEPLSEEDLVAILEGKKKTSVSNMTNITFVLYEEVCTEKERAEMNEIINEVDTWAIVDEDEADDPVFFDEENCARHEFLFDKAEQNPTEAITELEALIAENPNEYYFYNLLSLAYSSLGENEKEYETIVSTYARFPHKILAFSNYVDTLLEQKKFAELHKFVGSRFDLQKFFPQRQNLSFKELLSLAGTLLLYFSKELGELHKGIAYTIPLCSFIFYGDNRPKAKQILLFANKLMIKEIAKRKELDDKIG